MKSLVNLGSFLKLFYYIKHILIFLIQLLKNSMICGNIDKAKERRNKNV